MKKVYVVNKSAHDFSAAEKFGELHFLTNGRQSKYAVSNMHRELSEGLADSKPSDYLLLTSLTVLNAVATAILIHKHGVVNFLIHKNDSYVVRTIVV